MVEEGDGNGIGKNKTYSIHGMGVYCGLGKASSQLKKIVKNRKSVMCCICIYFLWVESGWYR